jgi:hypothetical protein
MFPGRKASAKLLAVSRCTSISNPADFFRKSQESWYTWVLEPIFGIEYVVLGIIFEKKKLQNEKGMVKIFLEPSAIRVRSRVTSRRLCAIVGSATDHHCPSPIVFRCRRGPTIKCCPCSHVSTFFPIFTPEAPSRCLIPRSLPAPDSPSPPRHSSPPFYQSPLTIMPSPLNLAAASRPVAGLPQYTASSPPPCYPSPKYSDPPAPVKKSKSTQKPPSCPKPTRNIVSDPVHDLFSPRTWAKDGFQLYPDEVDATVAEFRNSVVCSKTFDTDRFTESGPSEARIDKFLKETELYDCETKRWRDIPEVCTKVGKLFRPMRVLVDAITEHFGYVTTRPVVDSFHIPENRLEFNQPHQKSNCVYRPTPLKKIPHMMALGVSGSNFGPLPSVFESGPSYAACISPVELQIEDQRNSTSDLIQLALYARCACLTL